MLLLKACPRCHGDLVFERDGHTGYLECMQCGHTLSNAEERNLGVRASTRGLLRRVGATHHAVAHTMSEPATSIVR